MRVLARWVTHVAIVVAVCGCFRHRASTSADGAPQLRSPATLVVKNNNFSDMVVYAVRSGDPIRLGMVTATSSGTFPLEPGLISSGSVHIFATPIGGNGRADSGSVLLSGGQTMTFTIQQNLAASSVLVQ